ncbi:MAG TPA: hypothetical protein VF883_23875 [Thermoanaerobaculia bacterium]|jgi:hypothetical protein
MSLLWAERAVDYVRTTVGMLSNNRQYDQRIGDVNVGAARVEGYTRSSNAEADEHKQLAAEASAYVELKAGNCDEMAKAAFVWLAQHDEVRPLELAYFSSVQAAVNVRLFGTNDHEDVEPDHSFVIIGRQMGQAERRERQQNIISMSAYSTWNFGTVICDPWAKRAYMAHKLLIEAEMINRVTANRTQLSCSMRLEVGERWRG